jgi:phosphoethanolamine N-methyltransferase
MTKHTLQSEHLTHAKDFNTFTWIVGKKILAEIRGGDYAHAGEEAAIQKIFENITPSKEREILDIGCGLGGTAAYIQEHGWGKVTGCDIEEPAVLYAKNKYPKVDFFVADASSSQMLMQNLENKKFDLICLIHSLCVFKEPLKTLQNLKLFAKPDATLIIFEYLNLLPSRQTITDCHIYSQEQFNLLLAEANWQIAETTIISKEFEIWYQKLINNAHVFKKKILDQYGKDYFTGFCETYSRFLEALKAKTIGGCIIYCKPM